MGVTSLQSLRAGSFCLYGLHVVKVKKNKKQKQYLTSSYLRHRILSEMVSLFVFRVQCHLFSSESVKCAFLRFLHKLPSVDTNCSNYPKKSLKKFD